MLFSLRKPRRSERPFAIREIPGLFLLSCFFQKLRDCRTSAFKLLCIRMTERLLLLFKAFHGEMTLLSLGDPCTGESAVKVYASAAEIMPEQGVVIRRERCDIFAYLCGVRRVDGDSERADDDELLSVHPGYQVDRVVVRRSVIAPIGKDKGIEFIYHLIRDVADVVGPDMIGHRLRRRDRELVGISRDR